MASSLSLVVRIGSAADDDNGSRASPGLLLLLLRALPRGGEPNLLIIVYNKTFRVAERRQQVVGDKMSNIRQAV